MIGRVVIEIDTNDWTEDEDDKPFDENNYTREQVKFQILDEMTSKLLEAAQYTDEYIEFEESPIKTINTFNKT